jgi:hypothetical protein
VHVVISGSRGWKDVALIEARALRLPSGSEVIVGGAGGVDRMFEAAARRRTDLSVIVDKAAWTATADTPPDRVRQRADGSAFDIAAGVLRNERMLTRLEEFPDNERLLLAFWLGRSRGTWHCITTAMSRKIPVEIHWRPE